MDHFKQKMIEDCLGLRFDVFEESWNDEDGPSNEDYRVMQRCLILLGYPTGENGRSWIDGVVGPNTRRALKQYQEENGFEVTGRFDAVSRPALYHAANEWLGRLEEKVVSGSTGQLRRVANQSGFSGKNAVYYYLSAARARVKEELQSGFLALTTIHDGETALSLDLNEYQRLQTQGASPKEARLAASHYGFLQLPAAYFSTNKLDLNRACVCGDLDFHLDTIAHVLLSDPGLGEAAVRRDAAAVTQRFPYSRFAGPVGLEVFTDRWREVDACLPK